MHNTTELLVNGDRQAHIKLNPFSERDRTLFRIVLGDLRVRASQEVSTGAAPSDWISLKTRKGFCERLARASRLRKELKHLSRCSTLAWNVRNSWATAACEGSEVGTWGHWAEYHPSNPPPKPGAARMACHTEARCSTAVAVVVDAFSACCKACKRLSCLHQWAWRTLCACQPG